MATGIEREFGLGGWLKGWWKPKQKDSKASQPSLVGQMGR